VLEVKGLTVILSISMYLFLSALFLTLSLARVRARAVSFSSSLSLSRIILRRRSLSDTHIGQIESPICSGNHFELRVLGIWLYHDANCVKLGCASLGCRGIILWMSWHHTQSEK